MELFWTRADKVYSTQFVRCIWARYSKRFKLFSPVTATFDVVMYCQRMCSVWALYYETHRLAAARISLRGDTRMNVSSSLAKDTRRYKNTHRADTVIQSSKLTWKLNVFVTSAHCFNYSLLSAKYVLRSIKIMLTLWRDILQRTENIT